MTLALFTLMACLDLGTSGADARPAEASPLDTGAPPTEEAPPEPEPEPEPPPPTPEG